MIQDYNSNWSILPYYFKLKYWSLNQFPHFSTDTELQYRKYISRGKSCFARGRKGFIKSLGTILSNLLKPIRMLQSNNDHYTCICTSLLIITLWNKSIFHALSYNLFSSILFEDYFSAISYVITKVLQALRKSYHQQLYSKTDALLLNTFSRGARECKHCLHRLVYQRKEKHTLKIHKNIIGSFGLLPPQSRIECFLKWTFF